MLLVDNMLIVDHMEVVNVIFCVILASIVDGEDGYVTAGNMFSSKLDANSI